MSKNKKIILIAIFVLLVALLFPKKVATNKASAGSKECLGHMLKIPNNASCPSGMACAMVITYDYYCFGIPYSSGETF